MELQKDTATYKKGVFAGAFTGLTWGMHSVLTSLVMVMGGFIEPGYAFFVAPLVASFLNYIFSTIWFSGYAIARGKVKSSFAALKTKSGRALVLASLFGGPIGFGLFYISIHFIGAGFASSISALFPILTGVFSYFLLKEKLKLKNWLGVIISIAAIAFLWFAPDDVGNENFILGVVFAFGSAIAWALETVIIAWGMKDDDIGSEEALFIRNGVALVAYAFVIIPIIGGLGMTMDVLTSYVGLYLAGIALIGTISYAVYYKVIDMIGPSKASVINITYAGWAVVFGLIFGDGTEFSLILAACIALIIFGTSLASKK